MTVTIEGNTSSIKRIQTGLWSFDRAFENRKGEIGFPLNIGTEIYGVNHCGKSTITYSLAGIIGKGMEQDIALADFEGFDPDFLQTVLESSGFSGKLKYIQEPDDETALDNLIHDLRDKKNPYCVGIVDSLGAISPLAEQSGDIGEANMGRRAFLLAQFSRKAIKLLRETETPKNIFMINHAYPQIGGRGKTTPGGEVKNYLNSVRISIKRRYYKGKYEEFPDGSYVIEGDVIKNRWGYKDRKFYLFVLSGSGIHQGLTAMYDAIVLGLVDKKKTIQIGDTSFGYLKNIIDEAQKGNEEFFDPFFEVLHEYKSSEILEEVGDEDAEDTDTEIS